MEQNTFATAVFAQAPADAVFAYLRELKNLDEWTLGSRMVHSIDRDPAMGTASGYQSALCYHVRTLPHERILAIEWQCGYRYRDYFKQYPVFVFPSRDVDPGCDENGSYIHWISVVDPARRTPMIMEGIAAVHRYESRGLKAALERAQCLRAPAQPRCRIETDTIWVDAPIDLAREELSEPARLPQWSRLFRAGGEAGLFLDEYNLKVQARFVAHSLDDYVLVEQDYVYTESGQTQRCPVVLLPCERAFGSGARGFRLRRRVFGAQDGDRGGGRGVAELTAENMALKRRLEARAGNPQSFALAMSYQAPARAAVHPAAPPDIFSPEFMADPYPLYRTMRDEYPLYFHLPTRAWMLSRYADVHAALTNPVFTTKSYAAQTEPLLGRTLIQLDGREHALQRRLLTPSFRSSGIRVRFDALIRSTVEELVAAFAPRGKADLVSELATQLPVRIMSGMLALPAQDRARFPVWYTALIRGALNLAGDPEVARAANTARDELDAYLRPLINQRRVEPGDDLISQLATTEIEGERLSEEQIVPL